MNNRRMTLILVPHEDLETRSVTLSYRRVKLMLGGVVALGVAFVLLASTWWYVAAQASRVRGLEAEVRRLETERVRVTELARTLEDVEAQYEHVRQLLGADGGAKGKDPILPPLVTERTGMQTPAPQTSTAILPSPGS